MNLLTKRVMLATMVAASVNLANAWQLEVSAGHTGQSENTFRVGARSPWEGKYFDTSVGYLSGYWDVAYTYWEKGKYGKDVSSISLSPVLTYNFYTGSGMEPFIELGVGIAAFSKTKVGDQNLGSSVNFEDRIGIGATIGAHTFGARAIHYSNAGLKRPNEGIESYALYYAYEF